MATKSLDCSGLRCPMPIVKVSKAINEILPGQTLEVTATDNAFEPDIKSWCNKTGNVLSKIGKEGAVTKAVITKK